MQDWRRSADAREYAPTEHPMAQLPAVEFFGPADAVCSYVHQHRHDDNGQVLRQLRAFDEEHGTGAVVAGLEAAREHLGGLPELLEELLRRLAPERWSA